MVNWRSQRLCLAVYNENRNDYLEREQSQWSDSDPKMGTIGCESAGDSPFSRKNKNTICAMRVLELYVTLGNQLICVQCALST